MKEKKYITNITIMILLLAIVLIFLYGIRTSSRKDSEPKHETVMKVLPSPQNTPSDTAGINSVVEETSLPVSTDRNENNSEVYDKRLKQLKEETKEFVMLFNSAGDGSYEDLKNKYTRLQERMTELAAAKYLNLSLLEADPGTFNIRENSISTQYKQENVYVDTKNITSDCVEVVFLARQVMKRNTKKINDFPFLFTGKFIFSGNKWLCDEIKTNTVYTDGSDNLTPPDNEQGGE